MSSIGILWEFHSNQPLGQCNPLHWHSQWIVCERKEIDIESVWAFSHSLTFSLLGTLSAIPLGMMPQPSAKTQLLVTQQLPKNLDVCRSSRYCGIYVIQTETVREILIKEFHKFVVYIETLVCWWKVCENLFIYKKILLIEHTSRIHEESSRGMVKILLKIL